MVTNVAAQNQTWSHGTGETWRVEGMTRKEQGKMRESQHSGTSYRTATFVFGEKEARKKEELLVAEAQRNGEFCS